MKQDKSSFLRGRFTPLLASLRAPLKADRTLGVWCLVLAFMVFGMVIGGGHARTIGAGFSIQVWEPVMGFVPPLNAADWNSLFALYQKTAVFQAHPISLDEYKSLFWPMFIDRNWGRLMALVFLLPFTWFFATGRLRGRAALWMLFIFGLGAGQAVWGWYMVTQATYPGVLSPPPAWAGPHLASAMVILLLEIWTGLTFLRPEPVAVEASARVKHLATASVALLWCTIFFGGMVATSGALKVFNTFPMMDGHWLPPHMFGEQPFLMNFVTNEGTVQFFHRLLATVTAVTVLATAVMGLRSKLSPGLRDNFLLLAGLVALQYLLGMTTLVLGSNGLGYVHELNAVLLFATAVFARHGLRGAIVSGEPSLVHPEA